MGKEAATMEGGMIPKSVLAGVIKDTIKTQSDEKIAELTDILYSGFSRGARYETRLDEHSVRLDQQHLDTVSAIQTMKAGFESMESRFRSVDTRFESMDKRFESMDKRFESLDKRFDDLIHQMDKRFEAVDKRFSMLTWFVGIGFVIINLTIVALKVF